jgi:hypothetical protein
MKKFKIVLPFFFMIAFIGSGFSQSPYYALKFSVTEIPWGEMNLPAFDIMVETCSFEYKPVVPSDDYWFGKDTSQLNWDNLPDSMYNALSCIESKKLGDSYDNSNQDMVWENIYKIRIVKNNRDTMTVVYPVLIKSFVTFMDLGAIPFTPGYFEITRDLVYIFNDNVLSVTLPDSYIWKSINFDDRKIKLER